MHDGVMPSSFTANQLQKVPNEKEGKEDMKKENRRKGARRPRNYVSFTNWLRYRARAEEEEMSHEELDAELRDEELDDEDELDFDEMEKEEDPEMDDYEDLEDESDDELEDEDSDPEEFDDYGEERELDFDDDSSAPFPIGSLTNFYRMDDEDGEEDYDEEEPTSGFSDFYRDREEEEEAPGGFDPGQAVGGNAGGMGKPAIERAHILFRQVMNLPDMNREKMIQLFMQKLGITESTAISYYEDIAREMGLYDRDEDERMGGEDTEEEAPVDQLPGDTVQELSQEEIDAQDPNAQGIKRTVANAHMVYKRQQEDGTFEELWIYNIGDKMDDSLSIRREILSGTDIPRGHTRSEDGKQSYTLQTMGNAQMLHITGLPN